MPERVGHAATFSGKKSADSAPLGRENRSLRYTISVLIWFTVSEFCFTEKLFQGMMSLMKWCWVMCLLLCLTWKKKLDRMKREWILNRLTGIEFLPLSLLQGIFILFRSLFSPSPPYVSEGWKQITCHVDKGPALEAKLDLSIHNLPV